MPKIDKKITDFKVVNSDKEPNLPVYNLERGESLTGATYKIKPTGIDHAVYITINDITLPDGSIKPFEIFINSKHQESHQWCAITTRLISAIWRNGGDCHFVIEEMKVIHDPKGGYFAKKLGFVPSMVAHIGAIIEQHLECLNNVPI